MKKKILLIIFFVFAGNVSIISQEITTPNEPGKSFAFDLDFGTAGSFSMFETGIFYPVKNKNFFLGFKARAMSSLTWATYTDRVTGETASFHPVAVAGIISIGGFSPLVHDMMRAYGGMDILIGHTFTPYDDALTGSGNLIGDNLTYGIYGYFGLEIFTGKKISVYMDAGGGFKNFLLADENDINVIAASWLGSGFSFKMGMRFYLK